MLLLARVRVSALEITVLMLVCAQWVVATPSSGNSWVCIGDINRMTSQQKRGGGTVCFRDSGMWKVFSGAVTGHDSCPSLALRG